MTDILKDLYAGRITSDEARQKLDAALEAEEAGSAASLFKIDGVEWTAFGHGAALEEIARWRYEGWPTQCAVCGREIHAERFGWLVMQKGGRSTLRHIECRPFVLH